MLFPAETYMICVNIFNVLRNEISLVSDKKCKISLLVTSSIYMTLPILGDFYKGGLWGNSMSFVKSNWNFVSEYIQNVDAYCVSFSLKSKKVIKKSFLKTMWLTNMKCTVDHSHSSWALVAQVIWKKKMQHTWDLYPLSADWLCLYILTPLNHLLGCWLLLLAYTCPHLFPNPENIISFKNYPFQ